MAFSQVTGKCGPDSQIELAATFCIQRFGVFNHTPGTAPRAGERISLHAHAPCPALCVAPATSMHGFIREGNQILRRSCDAFFVRSFVHFPRICCMLLCVQPAAPGMLLC